MSGVLDVTLAGETLRLTEEGVVIRPDAGEAFVADLHLGKGSAFRQSGVNVPSGDSGADLDRLAGIVKRHGVTRLWILGDLVHAPASWTPELVRIGEAWRARLDHVNVALVRGNHDRRGGDPPASWQIDAHDAPAHAGRLALLHEPPWDAASTERRAAERPGAGTGEGAGTAEPSVRLAGHLHPVLRLGAGRGAGLRARCFWWHAGTLVLPAFGGFTGGARITPHPDDRVFVAGPGAVIEVPVPGAPDARSGVPSNPKRTR